MDTQIEVNPFGVLETGSIQVIKKLVYNGEVLKRMICRCAVSADTLDTSLSCMWDGDTDATSISLADSFPAEYAYLKAKLSAEA